MNYLDYARLRIQSCIDELENLLQSEFPYQDSQIAFEYLLRKFTQHNKTLKELDNPSNDPEIVKHQCSITLKSLFEYLPVIGFVLRSTNIRNGFELYRPLLRLGKSVIEANLNLDYCPGSHLLLASEWEYSPYTMVDEESLPEFILMGFPAIESSNPLIVPLAGHEFGHPLWSEGSYEENYKSMLMERISKILSDPRNRSKYNEVFPNPPSKDPIVLDDLFVWKHLERAWIWAVQQTKETFCDFIGLRLFGSSFLYSFAYLLSPSPDADPNFRSFQYPDTITRARNLHRAAEKYMVPLPEDFIAQFNQISGEPEDIEICFLLNIAEQALESVIPDLLEEVSMAVDPAKIILPTPDETNRIYQRFLKMVPAESSRSLADIANAAWLAFETPNLWGEVLDEKKRLTVLRDLVLKAIEVFEIEQIQGEKS